MRPADGKHRPRPVASTSVSGERPRTAWKASESAGRGGAHVEAHTQDRNANARKDGVYDPPEVTEAPNASSLMGLSRPTLIDHPEQIIDAANRGAVVKGLVVLVGLPLILITLALIAATFCGVPTAGLVSFAKWLGEALIPLLSLALGYYFGRTQHERQHS